MSMRISYAILLILFNGCGITKFLAGDWKNGLLRLLICAVILPLYIVNIILGLLTALDLFKMTDEEFEEKKDSIEPKFFPDFIKI